MIKKKIVFISGSSSGIGFYLAKLFQNDDFIIIINGKNIKKLKKSSSELNNCSYIQGDLTNSKDIKKIITEISKKFGYIDVLISNQGNSNFKKNNLDLDFAFKNNFFSSVNLILNSQKILKKNSSKIICISSICGKEIINGAPIGYSVAKSALNFFIKSFSNKLANDGITINGIMPGNILFEDSVWQKKLDKNKKLTKKYIKENVPVNEFGTVKDIFSICKMIYDQSSKFLTGTIIKIDGGQTKSI